MKRTFDVIFSSFALIVLAPFFVIIAIVIKISSKGPVFYPAKRIGQNRRNGDRRINRVVVMNNRRKNERRREDSYGKIFYMKKFRSMIVGADKLGSSVTFNGDPRVTTVGRFLRKTKLDELPSLINVLKGEMSLVGPRPESPPWVERYSQQQKEVLNVKPGITGLAQIKYRNEEDILSGTNLEEQYIKVMSDKLTIDLSYIKNRNLFLDLKILAKTIMAIP